MWVSPGKLEILLPSIKLSLLILTAMTIFIAVHESILGLFISWPLCLIRLSSELAVHRRFQCKGPKVPLKILPFVLNTVCTVSAEQAM